MKNSISTIECIRLGYNPDDVSDGSETDDKEDELVISEDQTIQNERRRRIHDLEDEIGDNGDCSYCSDCSETDVN